MFLSAVFLPAMVHLLLESPRRLVHQDCYLPCFQFVRTNMQVYKFLAVTSSWFPYECSARWNRVAEGLVECSSTFVRADVLVVMTVDIIAFRDMTPCSVVEIFKCFWWTFYLWPRVRRLCCYPEECGSRCLHTVSKLLPDSMESHQWPSWPLQQQCNWFLVDAYCK